MVNFRRLGLRRLGLRRLGLRRLGLRRALFLPARPFVFRVDVVRGGDDDGRGEGELFGDGDGVRFCRWRRRWAV